MFFNVCPRNNFSIDVQNLKIHFLLESACSGGHFLPILLPFRNGMFVFLFVFLSSFDIIGSNFREN